MATYFNFAHGTRLLAAAGNYPWPYDIDICFEPVAHPIAFSVQCFETRHGKPALWSQKSVPVD